MEAAALASRLVVAEHAERLRLLQEHNARANVELAYTLKDFCLEGWTSDPARAVGAAAALDLLSELNNDAEVAALAAWGNGIAALVNGQMEQAIARLDDSEARFLVLGKSHVAASTQVSKLIALAMLGRYDEAIEYGLRARTIFLSHDNIAAAGRVENNIGNIYLRRDQYQEAESFQQSARARFLSLNDQKQLAKIENSLAIIHSLQHKFRSAEQLYDQALKRAEATGLIVTQAEIESSLGNLALFQGRYDRALDYLERARRRYAAMGMLHESAISELEIADAYLELNLAPEASTIYERISKTFAELGMRAEQALATAHHGRVLIMLGQRERAHKRLIAARELYSTEGNTLGAALVTLTEAQLHQDEGNYQEAMRFAELVEAPLVEAGTWRHLLLARWVRGEALRALGKLDEARTLIEATLHDAEAQAQPQVAQRCHTSLGLLAVATGDAVAAEASFKQAVHLIEDLRAPLPAEEFRTAFFADKLQPYNELVRLCLSSGTEDCVAETLGIIERSRSRALVDMMGGTLNFRQQPRDSFEAEQVTRLGELREELNWFYSQLNRPVASSSVRSAHDVSQLQDAVRERERATLDIMRQLQHRGESVLSEVEEFDLAQLQSALSTHTALVEYTSLDDELLAFVVTDAGVEVVRHLGSEKEMEASLAQLRFQIETMRHGAERMRKHLPRLTERVRQHLMELYDLLLRSVEELIGERRLLVVPHRALHYVPFHALHDETGYVIERREVCYAPSAIVLRHCLALPQRPFERAVLLGVADEQTPRVRDEINALAPLFPEAVALLDDDATLAAVHKYAPAADVLHLACHGQFRPDNPLFSSLRLADGWLTVRDAYNLDLHCGLVALSACETGVNAIAPGDELIGLARGFFSAGAPSLLLSLWTVDDATTATLMTTFYTRLRAGDSPAAALRAAQCELLAEHSHPYFWSPFVLMGRW
jgi:CHAT domain-containing protein/tetratricopeptide (TPR) repeat protein